MKAAPCVCADDGNVGLFYGGNSTLATAAPAPAPRDLQPRPTDRLRLIETVVMPVGLTAVRDGQGYTIAYSTVSAPTTFVNLITTSYNPSVPGSTPSADRISVYSAPAAPWPTTSPSVKFTFLNVENGYSGYAELQVFGTPSAPLVLSKATISGGNLTVTSSGGIPGGAYAILTTTERRPAAGPVDHERDRRVSNSKRERRALHPGDPGPARRLSSGSRTP